MAAPCAGNSRLVFALCCAFGGPLMGPLVVQTGGFHLVGDSSLGKTTALLMAASVWGPPNFKKQWRQTDNALEGTAAQHSDSLLILDEIGQAEGRIVGECAYMLANEQEKGRAQRSLQLRKLRTWRLLFLSSGEKSLADHMEEAGKKANEGQLLRMPSVPADAGMGMGMLEDLHGGDDAKHFVETITKAAPRTTAPPGTPGCSGWPSTWPRLKRGLWPSWAASRPNACPSMRTPRCAGSPRALRWWLLPASWPPRRA